MKIDYIVCPGNIEEKLESKHHVTAREARQVLLQRQQQSLLVLAR